MISEWACSFPTCCLIWFPAGWYVAHIILLSKLPSQLSSFRWPYPMVSVIQITDVLCQDSFHLLGKYHISCLTVLVAVDWSLLFWNRQISLKRRSTYIVAGSCFPHRHFFPCDCRLPASVPLSLVLLYLHPIVVIISVSTIYIIKKSYESVIIYSQ